MDKVAIFPGSFDPFTAGHEALVQQALALFDRVVVAIGHNPSKSGLLSCDERRALIEDLYSSQPRVEVVVYDTLTTDLARSVGAVAIIRGVRNTTDFEFERSMAAINSRLEPTISTVVLFPPAHLSDVTSSVVRELRLFGHSVKEYMPEGVDIDKYIK